MLQLAFPRFIFSIKTISLVVLSMQTTTMVLMLRYSRTLTSSHATQSDAEETSKPDSGHHYIVSTAIYIAEILKLIVSLFLLHLQHGFKRASTCSELHREVMCNVPETCKMVIPAGLYLLQNNLLFVALSNLDAATYQVTYQLRILCTAGFSWLLLGRRLSLTHWLALACLMIGVALVQVDVGSSAVANVGGSTHSQLKMGASQLGKIPSAALPPALKAEVHPVAESDVHPGSEGDMPELKLPELPAALDELENNNPKEEAAQEDGHLKSLMDSLQQRFGGGFNSTKSSASEVKSQNEIPSRSNVPLGGVEAGVIRAGSAAAHLQLLHDKALLQQASSNREVSWLLGLLAVLVSCILSSFSGVYFERLVKRSRQTSLLIRNIQLGIFSIMFGTLSVCNDHRVLWRGGFFQGYTWATWAVIALQAGSGLVVSVTMKYADNILKVFATSVSIVLSALLSTYLLGHSAPTIPFIVGTAIVLGATLLYAVAPTPGAAVSKPSEKSTQQVSPLKETRSPPSYLLVSSPSEYKSLISRSRSTERLPIASEEDWDKMPLMADPRSLSVGPERCKTRSFAAVSLPCSATSTEAKVQAKEM
ncbi:UDP-N-acetylglucosamine transporter isoform X2 [Hyalella azteca]|uniref:UDP-N-acetylglucosamine transporter isoform X2 n=1 Tax=Hyalella azteca TaxID=294128 RepID=A0A8B7NDN1_HYAAZ|nr:UDP-N-acetylglucosamine transporter isoform X2 [Hyalella azteca]